MFKYTINQQLNFSHKHSSNKVTQSKQENFVHKHYSNRLTNTSEYLEKYNKECSKILFSSLLKFEPNFEPQTPSILKKMTLSILETYTKINKLYYAEKCKRKCEESSSQILNNSYTLKPSHSSTFYRHEFKPGDTFANERYIIDSYIGKGSFGVVVKAYDKHEGKQVAIKIVKKCVGSTRTEIEILRLFKSLRNSHVMRLLDTFVCEKVGVQCLVFELLTLNLFDLLRISPLGALKIDDVRLFAKQLIDALVELKYAPNGGVLHCDLKPENIMLVNSSSSKIRLIDFGSACFEKEKSLFYIQSRYYRSLEVLLELPYSFGIDMQSVACICMELFIGRPLFAGSTEFEQLCRIISVLGMPPAWYVLKSAKGRQYFKFRKSERKFELELSDRNGQSPTLSEIQNQSKSLLSKTCTSYKLPLSSRQITSIHELIQTSQYLHQNTEQSDQEKRNLQNFEDLIKKMLVYDPSERIEPLEAREHPFLKKKRQGKEEENSVYKSSVDFYQDQRTHHQKLPQLPSYKTQPSTKTNKTSSSSYFKSTYSSFGKFL